MSWLFLFFALLSGAVLGLIYFGGLWYTLRKAAEYQPSYWLIFGSFLIRLVFALLVFYVLMVQHWAYMAIALCAFLVMRQILIIRVGKPEEVLYG